MKHLTPKLNPHRQSPMMAEFGTHTGRAHYIVRWALCMWVPISQNIEKRALPVWVPSFKT